MQFRFSLSSRLALWLPSIWPARYVAQGTILVQSQEIPSDLVRPTIAALANDRIQIIEQRVMTRDNLLAIAKKYQLTSGWLERVSGTEIVDFIRKRTLIKPSEQKLESRKKEAIAFTIGFEYERPDIATKVANELVTMLLIGRCALANRVRGANDALSRPGSDETRRPTGINRCTDCRTQESARPWRHKPISTAQSNLQLLKPNC